MRMGLHFHLLPTGSSVSLWAATALCTGANCQSEHLFSFSHRGLGMLIFGMKPKASFLETDDDF